MAIKITKKNCSLVVIIIMGWLGLLTISVASEQAPCVVFTESLEFKSLVDDGYVIGNFYQCSGSPVDDTGLYRIDKASICLVDLLGQEEGPFQDFGVYAKKEQIYSGPVSLDNTKKSMTLFSEEIFVHLKTIYQHKTKRYCSLPEKIGGVGRFDTLLSLSFSLTQTQDPDWFDLKMRKIGDNKDVMKPTDQASALSLELGDENYQKLLIPQRIQQMKHLSQINAQGYLEFPSTEIYSFSIKCKRIGMEEIK